MPTKEALLLSIRPKFAEQIFAGSKQVELRRVRPRIGSGDLVVVYVSGETQALAGAFQVAGVVEASPATVWRRFASQTGLTKKEFDTYYEGKSKAYAIQIAHAWRLPVAVCLTTLRKRQANFRPPQSYQYLDASAVLSIGGAVLLETGKSTQKVPKR